MQSTLSDALQWLILWSVNRSVITPTFWLVLEWILWNRQPTTIIRTHQLPPFNYYNPDISPKYSPKLFKRHMVFFTFFEFIKRLTYLKLSEILLPINISFSVDKTSIRFTFLLTGICGVVVLLLYFSSVFLGRRYLLSC